MPPSSTSSDKATLYALQQPEKLRTTLQSTAVDDCLSCRLMGAAAFTGLGAYSYVSGHQQLRLQRAKILASGSRFGLKSRQRGITALSAMLVAVGLWRLVN